MNFETVDSSRFKWLTSIWREDLATHNGKWLAPGFHVVAIHRFGVWSLSQRGLGAWICNKVYTLSYIVVSGLYGAELPRRVVVGRRLWLPHPVGLVVSHQTEIGDDCMIRQNVTLGQYSHGRSRSGPLAPKLGHGVQVGPGAVVVGGVTVGDNARIGPNAVVMTDVPAGGSAIARSAGIVDALEAEEASPPSGSTGSSLSESDLEGFIEILIGVIRAKEIPEEGIGRATPLLSTGIIDSFDVTALLSAVESNYGVDLDPEKIDVDLFDTPEQMLHTVVQARRA